MANATWKKKQRDRRCASMRSHTRLLLDICFCSYGTEYIQLCTYVPGQMCEAAATGRRILLQRVVDFMPACLLSPNCDK